MVAAVKPEGAKAARAKAAATKADPKLTRFQKFTVVRVHRSQIKGAPYNPRRIDDYAKARLREGIQKLGLLEPVTVNKPTMMLVGGHQRLAALDVLEGHGNYLLDVSLVMLSPKQEREANILLNNPNAQGTWDLDALGKLLSDETVKLDVSATGFDPLELGLVFEGTEYAAMFSADGQDEQIAGDVAALAEMGEAAAAADAAERERKRSEEH